MTSNILQIIETIVVIFCCLVGFVLFVNLISAITDYFKAKRTALLASVREKEDPNYPERKLDLIDRIEATSTILVLISSLVDNEINHMITTLSRINQKYDAKNMDKDIKNISEAVFNAFKKTNNVVSNQFVVTDEFIMKYITEETITKLLVNMQNYNQAYSIKNTII